MSTVTQRQNVRYRAKNAEIHLCYMPKNRALQSKKPCVTEQKTVRYTA